MADDACKTLAGRFDEKRVNGLVDVKFCVGGRETATYEQLCEELESLYQSVDAGQARPLIFNDRRAAAHGEMT
jgi:hypothetical protein